MPIKLDTRCSCRSGCAGWPGCLGDANASSPQYRGNGLDDAPTGFGAVPGNMPFRTMLPSPSSLAPRQQLGAVVPASFSGSGLFMAPRTAHCTSATSHMSVGVTAAEFIYEAAERLPPDLAVLMEPPYIPEGAMGMQAKVLRAEFLLRLHIFMQDRGTAITPIPTLGHHKLDLVALYQAVIERGGVETVISNKGWRSVAQSLRLPQTCTDSGFRLRLHYLTCLYPYERRYFLQLDDNIPAKLRPMRRREIKRMAEKSALQCLTKHKSQRTSTSASKAVTVAIEKNSTPTERANGGATQHLSSGPQPLQSDDQQQQIYAKYQATAPPETMKHPELPEKVNSLLPRSPGSNESDTSSVFESSPRDLLDQDFKCTTSDNHSEATSTTISASTAATASAATRSKLSGHSAASSLNGDQQTLVPAVPPTDATRGNDGISVVINQLPMAISISKSRLNGSAKEQTDVTMTSTAIQQHMQKKLLQQLGHGVSTAVSVQDLTTETLRRYQQRHNLPDPLRQSEHELLLQLCVTHASTHQEEGDQRKQAPKQQTSPPLPQQRKPKVIDQRRSSPAIDEEQVLRQFLGKAAEAAIALSASSHPKEQAKSSSADLEDNLVPQSSRQKYQQNSDKDRHQHVLM